MKNGSFYRVDLEDKTLKISNGNKFLEYIKSLLIYIQFFLTCRRFLQPAALQVYLCLKMITCQNVLFKPQFTNLFNFMEKLHFILEIFFYIINDSINFKSCDFMVSIRKRGVEYIFGYILYLVNHKSFSHETSLTNRYGHG